ncbi:MAG: cytochrome C biogenesis protein [Candidatus Micrarchaeota archaeon]|nr:cytochrome C biogenesis protein [Candidatus Micrarchaeota archaeon]
MASSESVFLNSVFFVIGFAVVFSLVGILLQALFSHVAIQAMNVLRIIGGGAILVFGMLLVLSSRYLVPFFSGDHRLPVIKVRNSYLSAFLFGVVFAIGWTPCVGPILGSIYALAITSPGLGFLLLLSYSLGLGIPFLIAGFFISRISSFLRRMGPFLRYFNVAGGLMLILMGILVMTGYIGLLSVFLIGSGGSNMLAEQLNLFVALIAGMVTFLSPCILPLLPAYLSYMAGSSAIEAKG